MANCGVKRDGVICTLPYNHSAEHSFETSLGKRKQQAPKVKYEDSGGDDSGVTEQAAGSSRARVAPAKKSKKVLPHATVTLSFVVVHGTRWPEFPS